MSADRSQQFRLGSIDALRGVAAIAVALFHVWGHDGGYAFPSIGVVTQSQHITFFTYLVSPLRWGYLGVSLFLVISGFCIHLPYARKKYQTGDYQFAPREFFLRRMWRLYPAYFLAVVGTCIVIWLVAALTSVKLSDHWEIPTLGDLIGHLTMAHGVIEKQFYSIVTVFWSLSLEFQLYLAYPLFLFVFRKFGIRNSVFGIVIVSLVWRYFALSNGYGLISISAQGPYVLMGLLPARMAEWVFGAALADLFARKKANNEETVVTKSSFYIASIVLFLIAIASTFESSLWLTTDLLFGGSFVSLLAGATLHQKAENTNRMLISRFFVWVGIMSYSFYLFHLQWLWIVETQIKTEEGNIGIMAIRIGWILVGLLPVWLLYRFIEKPFMGPPKEGTRFYRFYVKLKG